jgi:hypothetical protein
MLIAELSILEPIELPNSVPIQKGLLMQMYGPSIGVVYGKEGAYVIMSRSVCELRSYAALAERSDNIIEIDMDAVDEE